MIQSHTTLEESSLLELQISESALNIQDCVDAFAEMTPLTDDEMAYVLVFLGKRIIFSHPLYLPHFGGNNRTIMCCVQWAENVKHPILPFP